MERKRIRYTFLFIVLILVSSSCHPRHVSDIKQNMTKEEVATLWGRTPLISYRTDDGKAVETWEYHFSKTDSICRVTFSQDKVVATQCRPVRAGPYWSYSQPGRSKAGPPPSEQDLVREGSFAMELVEVLKIGEVKSEAEAENKLTSVGIAPKNGWIADYPVTPDIIGELRNAVGEAADSGKIAIKREEATKAFQDLATSMESQSAGVETPIVGQPYPEPYYDPYYYPYPYYYGGYSYPFLYPYFRGGFGGRGFRHGGRGGGSHRGNGHGGGHGGGGRGGGHR